MRHETLTESLAARGPVDGQAAQEYCREGVFRQPLRLICRDVRELHGAGCEGVVADQLAPLQVHTSPRDVPLLILSSLLGDVVVQWRVVDAVERGAVHSLVVVDSDEANCVAQHVIPCLPASLPEESVLLLLSFPC